MSRDAGPSSIILLYRYNQRWEVELLIGDSHCQVFGSRIKMSLLIQELSYRKQIARKLRTQYVEGTHRTKILHRDLEI